MQNMDMKQSLFRQFKEQQFFYIPKKKQKLKPYHFLQILNKLFRKNYYNIQVKMIKYSFQQSYLNWNDNNGYSQKDIDQRTQSNQQNINNLQRLSKNIETFIQQILLFATQMNISQAYLYKYSQHNLQQSELEKINKVQIQILTDKRIFNNLHFIINQLQQSIKFTLDKYGQFEIYQQNFLNQTYQFLLLTKPKNAKKMLNPFYELQIQFEQWDLGFFEQKDRGTEQSIFCHYFNLALAQKHFRKINENIKFQHLFLFNIYQKQIKILSYFYEGNILKLEINPINIKKMVRKQLWLYLQLQSPIKFYYHNVPKGIGFNKKFTIGQRIDNFPLTKNKKFMKNNLHRLFLMNNTVIKLCFKQKKHIQKVISTFQNLQMNINNIYQNKDINLVGQHSVFQFSSIYNLDQNIINNVQIDQQCNSEQQYKRYNNIWKIKYLILCLWSKNKISRIEQMKEIINFVQKAYKQSIQILIYTLQQIYNSKKSITEIQSIFKANIKIKNLILKKQDENQYSKIIHVYRIALTPSGFRFSIKQPELGNRLLRKFQKHHQEFIRINICDDNLQNIIGRKKYLTKKFLRNYINNYNLLGKTFQVLGWSPSQLRNYSFWLLNVSNSKIISMERVFNFLGDFDLQNSYPQEEIKLYNYKKIKNPAKKAARIGQVFSSSFNFFFKNPINQQPQLDIQNQKGQLFSDGIGKISLNILKNIQLELKIQNLSVIQIRYRGAKGILAVDQTLDENIICLRPSMVKYPCEHIQTKKQIDILDFNKYRKGIINRQIILLLATLGIKKQMFVELQNQYLKSLKNNTFHNGKIFKNINIEIDKQNIISVLPIENLIRKMINENILIQEEPFIIKTLLSLKKKGLNKLIEKSNFNVDKAVRLIGILDQYKLLNQKQIYVQFKNNNKLQNVTGKVFITRNPCLHPGDIKILKAISSQEIYQRVKTMPNQKIKKWLKKYQNKYQEQKYHPFKPFINTIIFPQVGKRPITCQISGSDLDGDMFFICWDERLIPDNEIESMKYDDEKPKQNLQANLNDMLDFFFQYLNYDVLGKVDNYHLVYSDLSNYLAKSSESLELAKIHAVAVDFAKKGIYPIIPSKFKVKQYPDFMQKEFEKTYISYSVLGIVFREAIKNSKEIYNKLILDYKLSEKKCKQSIKMFIPSVKLDFTYQQILQFVNIYALFSIDIQILLNCFEMEDQFDLYVGNFKKQKIITGEKVIRQLLKLKNEYLNVFFYNLENDFIQFHSKFSNKLSEKCLKKAYLWYVGIYILVYDYIDSGLQILNEKIRNLMKFYQDVKFKYIGLGWFVIGDIILQMKKYYSFQQQDQHQLDL